MARQARRPQGLLLDEEGEKILGERSALANQNTGHMTVRLYPNRVLLHRYLWEGKYGEAPAVIDHINGNPKDNRFSNLRAATSSLNALNRKNQSKSGLPKGVTYKKWCPNRPYQALLQHKGKQRSLGCFATPEEAAAAYKGAAALLILEEQLQAEKEWLYEL